MADQDPIPVFDGHNDSVQHLAEYRRGGRDFLIRSDDGHLDLPRARAGGMIGGLFALFAKPERPPVDDLWQGNGGYEVRLADRVDPSYARGQIERQRQALEAGIVRSGGAMCWASSVNEIEAHHATGIFSVVLHLEGAEAIGPDLEHLDHLYDKGLRSLGPVWSRPNVFGHGVPFAYPRSPDTGPGLTEAGRALVIRCNQMGVLIDLSHLNERGFWDVASISSAPLVVTHACAHAVCASTRNLTDRQLDAIRDTNGIVGFNLCVNDVRPDARLDANTPLDTVVDHLSYLIDRLGEDHVALGSDFDGAVMPQAIGDASGLQNLIVALRDRGFNATALRKLATENWLRIFRRTWK